MCMSYADQDMFFAQAYRTGTDRWTNIPFTRRAHDLMLYLPKGSMVLDIGAGRGRLLYELHTLGFRCIGLEKNPDLVKVTNEELRTKGLEHDMRFVEGDALNMPLADAGFDAAVDVCLMQHLLPSHYAAYISEVARVLKHEGFFFLVVLSKETPSYFTWHPRSSDTVDFQLEGVHYHFFSDDEIHQLLSPQFKVISIHHDMPYGPNDTVYSVVLMKKK